MDEGRCLQQRLWKPQLEDDSNHTARVFSRLMLRGKVKAAINFLSRKSSNGILKLEDTVPAKNANGEDAVITVKEALLLKHPTGTQAVIRLLRDDIREATGPLQVCAGLDSACEAAVHAIRDLFESPDTEGVLLVDATNAFNTLNRDPALHSISVLCPAVAKFLRNTYQSTIRMIIKGSGEISSTEGVTQGDPLAMAFYAVATMPLIFKLNEANTGAAQA